MLTKSKRISDFLLKGQYSIMIIIYTIALILSMVIILPIIYVKMVANASFILVKGKREEFQG